MGSRIARSSHGFTYETHNIVISSKPQKAQAMGALQNNAAYLRLQQVFDLGLDPLLDLVIDEAPVGLKLS